MLHTDPQHASRFDVLDWTLSSSLNQFLGGKNMQVLGVIEEAKTKVLNDARRCLERVQDIAKITFGTSSEAVRILQRLRSEVYEDLNQIQHEHLIICAAEWLLSWGICDLDTQWYWNPRQTGDATEPDLHGMQNEVIVVSAEITTSAKPEGSIDSRMRNTLAKLSQQSGQLFYFVQTEAMANRAETKILKAGWSIQVAQLP
ncbi:hypothetical protein [Pseudomonas chlororaphis]|uniref:hypothetical protein n=2 Tax=Pseudomonas chlororaphis TaxID=587753 RepID=UPI001B311BE6|nr:hypothetical protein [Pseudomonas chlororaphis]MBP5055220.1 hypothetical protein [Pseudomonas chlororaphis]MBP5140845.1 hypothetical protein [Pseudomonas chlororaphis]QTU00367.1 hypothetical protein HUT26_14095 [Pseudomonas chlororaphis]